MSGLTYWYQGPWQWNSGEEAGWSPPAGCSGGLDLRSLPQMEKKAGSPGLGIFWGVKPPVDVGSDYDLLGTGSFTDIKESRKLKDMLPARSGYRVKGDNLKRMLFDLLTDGSDPTGSEYAKPLMPSNKGELNLLVGGQQFRQNFRLGRHSHTNRVLDVVQRDMETHIEDAANGRLKDSEHHRRILDSLCDKYHFKGDDDWMQFVKANRIADIPGRLKHETTHTDDFNRASLGAGWTAVDGTWSINGSTELDKSGTGGTFPATCRYESDLSSSDHYSQIIFTNQLGDANGFMCGAVRFSSSSETCYFGILRSQGSLSAIYKIVSGTQTSLVSGSGGTAPPHTDYLVVDGSDLELKMDTVTIETVTDTSVTGNTRCGVAAHNSLTRNSRGDDFECADLAAGTTTTIVNLERDGERGIDRGIWTKGIN